MSTQSKSLRGDTQILLPANYFPKSALRHRRQLFLPVPYRSRKSWKKDGHCMVRSVVAAKLPSNIAGAEMCG